MSNPPNPHRLLSRLDGVDEETPGHIATHPVLHLKQLGGEEIVAVSLMRYKLIARRHVKSNGNYKAEDPISISKVTRHFEEDLIKRVEGIEP